MSIPVTEVVGDSTVRWSMRQGDLVVWIRPANALTSDGTSPKVIDLWEAIAGDSVLITNRIDDLPPWFELYYTEVSGALAHRFVAEIDRRHRIEAPLEAANLWRVRAGDFVGWIGEARPMAPALGNVLALARFQVCAAVVGEPRAINTPDLSLTAPRRQVSQPPRLAQRSGPSLHGWLANDFNR